MSIIPSFGGTNNAVESGLQKTGSDVNKNTLDVNAAYKYKKKYKNSRISPKKYKKWYKYKKFKKYKSSKYKKVKAARKKTIHRSFNNNNQISSSKVSANSRCSCSLSRDYKVHSGSWLNYCPYCHRKGTLSYTNGQGCPEGMFYCNMAKGGCDADFCAVHGKAHTYSKSRYLTPA
ncbi:MAG: hypothetical protein ACPK7O_05490 [Methanobacterium sp.]